jgi:hypothetical protein
MRARANSRSHRENSGQQRLCRRLLQFVFGISRAHLRLWAFCDAALSCSRAAATFFCA